MLLYLVCVLEADKRFDMKKMYEITAGIDQPAKSDITKQVGTKTATAGSYQSELDSLTKKYFPKPRFHLFQMKEKIKIIRRHLR